MHDEELAARLRAGDEAAFRKIITRYGGRLSRLARSFARTDAVIEEAVQETWMAVITGIHAFEGRAPLRTWIFGILVHQARRLGVKEHRHARVALGGNLAGDPARPREDAEDREPGMGRSGRWIEPPMPWRLAGPESAVLGKETLSIIEGALARLPEAQRQVVLLRDIEGLTAPEVCNILDVSDTNQRVLLHRGRAQVRRALDRYMKDGARETPPPNTEGR